ncbi:MAG: oxygen-dependent coproporphyrinogen oxidase [Pseudomonadota bacterium]
MADDVDNMVSSVRAYFLGLQAELCARFEALTDNARYRGSDIETPGGGLARPRVLAAPFDDSLTQRGIEKSAVQFTHSVGAALPPAATERNPNLAGLPFQALAVSVIVHPHNPYVPTCHMNVRFFAVASAPVTWYFGGGFDLTPCYGFEEDAVDWHRAAAQAVGAHYPDMKARCDDYFYLSHRNEARGIGGIFFDDWTEGGFTASLGLVSRVGDAFGPAYEAIFRRRAVQEYGEPQRHWQALRRGRYAEFNLAIDRGTRYGLQSGRRVESVLASLPPLVRWDYDHRPPEGSQEARLMQEFLPRRDWLGAVDKTGD